MDYVPDVREAVWDRDTRWLSRLLNRLHPADAADLLEQLSSDDFAACVDLLGGQLPTNIIIELRDEYREEAVEVLRMRRLPLFWANLIPMMSPPFWKTLRMTGVSASWKSWRRRTGPRWSRALRMAKRR